MTPSFLQKLFARSWIWTTGFFGIAVLTALALAMKAFPDWPQMVVLVLFGAIGGAAVSGVCLKVLWLVRVRINGGPFHKGDLVQVIAGVHAGKTATVYEEWPSRNQVRIGLGDGLSKEVKDVFSFTQICRIKQASPDHITH